MEKRQLRKSEDPFSRWWASEYGRAIYTDAYEAAYRAWCAALAHERERRKSEEEG